MNAVEIAEAVFKLSEQPFDSEEFPFAFLEAFGNNATTIKRLRKGHSNKSDLGGVLQKNNIHIAVTALGEATRTLVELKASPATERNKAKFVLATDGENLEAEEIASGDTIACTYKELPDRFGFFLPLAGISVVKEISDNAFDIRATSRLNRLYVQLLKDNPDWDLAESRHDMNHFMARLIFCFFAEDTEIFGGEDLLTDTIEQMTERDSSNTHEVIDVIFRSMNTKIEDRAGDSLPRWTNKFPYVNGGLFSGNMDVPRFSHMARSYLLHIGHLDWQKINPDIFGSMIQAVADEEERGMLGMHYTSVPNMLKVLNPLFLDELRGQLEKSSNNPRKLLNLRKRLSKIRVFDPACGSGNFLVIAYKELRAIEDKINKRRGEDKRPSEIPLTNFRGIELRDFAAEIARLALIIAEFQCNVLYLGPKLATRELLPLDAKNWIVCGNALRLDWLKLCPPTGLGVKVQSDDLFPTPLDQTEIDFENAGGETYICGNPPYKGSQTQSDQQKSDLAEVFEPLGTSSKQIDYVGGWFIKAAAYSKKTDAKTAFVSTNSICQGRIVPILWPKILEMGIVIHFAHTSFKWANLASHNAGVSVAIVGLSRPRPDPSTLYTLGRDDEMTVREVDNITPYLTAGKSVIVKKSNNSLAGLPEMLFGNMPTDGGNLLLSVDEANDLGLAARDKDRFIKRIYGSEEFIRGEVRYCLWIQDEQLDHALSIGTIKTRIDKVRAMRLASKDKGAKKLASRAHQFREMNEATSHSLVIPGVSSEAREYLPIGLIDKNSVISNAAFALNDVPVWNMALIASRLHLIWIKTVCGKLETRNRYSNTMGWNTFPVPKLTQKNIADLTRSAENILLTREAHFPATIAELYNSDKMPVDLREAHIHNDEVLERIYIGRRFRNDTERLEKLFDLYIGMTTGKITKKFPKNNRAYDSRD